ncbi:MAG: hypothetical protein R6V15_08905 [Desulfotignum sp.]
MIIKIMNIRGLAGLSTTIEAVDQSLNLDGLRIIAGELRNRRG